jgi:hypothetical protein
MRGVNTQVSKSRTITYLNQTTVIPGNEQFSIVTNEATSCNILESCDGLGYFLCPRGIYVHSGSCSDRISMWFRLCEMNRSNGSIFLDENGAFERPPISGFYAVFFWSRFCMFTWDDRLVIHTARERRVQITFSGSRVHRELLIDRFSHLFRFLLSLPIKNVVVQG